MLDKHRKSLKKSFIKSIIILSGGALLAQVINFVCSMIMVREYTKDTIGYYTYILSIVTMFSTVINGRYDVPIVSAENEEDAYSLVKLAFYLAIFISFIVMIGVYIASIFSQDNLRQNRNLILFIFPMLVIYGIINVLNGFNNRYEEYKKISQSYLIRTVWQNALTIGLGVFNPSSFNLLLSQVIGLCFGIKHQSSKIFNILDKLRRVSISDMKNIMIKYKSQPLVSVPASFINASSYSVISLLIGNIFGMNILATYSISVRVLGIPLGIFSTNIAKIHFKESADEIKNTGNYKKSTLKMISFSAILSILMVIFLVFFSPYLFVLLYGNNWADSGIYVQILAPMFGLRLVVGAVGFTFIIADKQKLELFFQIMLFAGMAIVGGISIFFKWDIKMFLIALSTVYTVIYLFELIEIIKCSRVKVR